MKRSVKRPHSCFGHETHEASTAPAVAQPLMEVLEQRLLLSGNGFLQGTAFVDTNNNAQLDLGEGYLAGAQIALTAPGADASLGTGDDVPVATQTTGADGAYLFSDIAPGDYRLIETPPAGYVNTGAQALSQLQPVLKQGANFIDVSVRALDNDPASPNPTPPFANYLGVNNSPRRWEGVSLSFFESLPFNLSAGELSISVGTASPWTDISPEKFTSFCVDLDAFLPFTPPPPPIGPTLFPVDIDPLSTEKSPPLAPAGLPANAGRMGYLYNHYPTFTTSTPDPAIEAGAVSLALYELRYDVNPDLSAENFKALGPDSRGFTSLADFNTMVALANQLIAESAGKNELILHLDSSLDGTVTTTEGRQSFIAKGSYNFGNQRSAALGDFVWNDLNANGIQDGGEPGIDGITVNLYDAGNNLVGTQPTAGGGLYLFTGLTPGDYQVAFVAPGWVASPANQGGDDTVDSDGLIAGTTTLVSGETDLTWDQGLYHLATIGDYVWVDTNADGIQNDGSTGINGVALTLTGTDGAGNAVTRQTTTVTNVGQAGYYQFANLVPGTYVVTVDAINPALTGFTASPTGQGSNPALDSNAQPAATSPVFLPSGGSDQTLDFGYYNPTPGIEIIKDVLGTAIVAPNTPVTFTYSVWNTGGVPISSVVVADDNATPDFAEDDFNPTPVLSGGFNIGDTNQNNLLDTTETWKYSTTVIPPVVMTVTPAVGGPTYSSGTLSYETLANGDVRVYYRQDNNFNDNTYGTGSDAGWTSRGKTHRFSDLTNSDKAGFLLKYSDGTVLAQFYQDYVTLGGTNTEGYAAWSGYQSLGFSGGDGSWVAGSTTAKTWLIDFDSTLETDLNQSGIANNGIAYTAMTVNSPVGDAKWDVVDGYAFTISAAAFTGGKSFGGVTIFDQHNSPAKTGGSNSYIPDIEGGGSVNTATVTGIGNGTTVTDNDSATVEIVTGPLGSIGDTVWFDANANGVQDGESGLDGWLVTLTGDFNGDNVADITMTDTTAGGGKYLFEGLPAGTYTVTLTPQANYTQTYDLDGLSTLNVANAALSAGQNRTDVDFGYVRTATGFSIDKTADKTTANFGEAITYNYEVRNTGSEPLSNVLVKDDNGTPNDSSDDFEPTYVSGDNGDGILETGEVWNYSATVIPPVQMTVTVNGQVYHSGSLSYTTLSNGDIRVVYRQSMNVNDNTYGTGSDIGWTSQGKTHKFSDLTGSDKAGFLVKYGDGTTLAQFYQDYITLGGTNTEYAANAWSGYQSLGFSGGDGRWVAGATNAQSWLVDFDSTLETDLNQSGTANNGVAYKAMTVSSPVGDAKWDVVDGYAFTISAAAFSGGKTFGGVTIFDQHNSPPKIGSSNSLIPTVVGGDLTNTAVVTATLGSDTVVALDDATVHVGPQTPGPGNVTASTPVVSGKVITLDLTNTGTTPVSIESLMLNWAASSKKLLKVKLDGFTLWDTKDSPTSVTIDTWKGKLADRTIGAGETLKITLEFEANATLTGLDLQVDFGSGPQDLI